MVGIYIFKNLKEKKCYIGQSSRLEERKYEHYHPRKKDKDEFHLNLIENPDDFEYKVLQECLVKELDTLESMWMNWYKNEEWELYNVCLRKIPNNRGKICSKESKKKMSEAKKGKYIGENSPMFGKHHSEEARKKISESNKGKFISEESKKKMSESHIGIQAGENHPLYGKHHSEEARKKISESRKGKCAGENHPMFGKHHSEETRKKMSELYKGRHWRLNPETGKREWY